MNNTSWNRRFVTYFHFVGWDCISFGAHICFSMPNVEIHLPFGFIRIGLVKHYEITPLLHQEYQKRTFGMGAGV